MEPMRGAEPQRPHLGATVSAVTPPAWHERAACRGMDVEVFFPEAGGQLQAEAAKRVCARCPVTAECLADALKSGLAHGVWGGMSARERKRMTR